MKIKRIFSLFCVFCAGFTAIIGDGDLRNIGLDSKTSSFNEMVVRHAKRLCNGGLYKIFSQDGRDFADFWLTANEVNLDLEKAYTSLRLFFNNVKSAEVVDYTVVDRVLEVSPKLFSRYFTVDHTKIGELNIMREAIEDELLGKFTEDLEGFQRAPDVFISGLTNGITNIVKSRLHFIRQENEEHEFRDKLRRIMIRFTDLMLNKTIWYAHEHERIWPSVLSIADNLHKLGIQGILDDQDNLDDLWDSLVRRLVWYVDFNGSSIPVETYEQMEEDLKNNTALFLEVEQDDGITTKKERLQAAIVRGKAKAVARENGILSDPIRCG